MSFLLNKQNQISLSDKYENLTVREKKIIQNSWAKVFSEEIFPLIKEERFSVLYSENDASRPNTPVNVIIGAMIIKELQGISDEAVVTSLIFDIRFQYALHTTSYKEQPISDRSFSRFRERLYEYERLTGKDLLKDEIKSLSQGISRLMKLSPHLKRMDSLMIASACKDMTRLEVVYATVSNLINAVHKSMGDELLLGLEHYLNSDDRNRVIYHNTTENRAAQIQRILEDGDLIIGRLGEEGALLPEYSLVQRLLEEQSTMDTTGKRQMKSNKEISPSSLQNPSDPEATYRKKNDEGHIGYVGNIVETFDGSGNSVITDYEFEQNRHSDSKFCETAIEQISKSGEATPEEKVVLIGDGAFGSSKNSELAEANNIKLVTTALTGPKPPQVFSDYNIDKINKIVLTCPAGYSPIRQSYSSLTENYRIVMERSQCKDCPHKAECNAKLQKKSAAVNVTENKVERAKVANNASVSQEEYAYYQHARNAIEGIPSVMRRFYNVDEMPVFGRISSKLFFGLKIAAINIKKLVKFKSNEDIFKTEKSYPQDFCAQI